MQQVFAIRHRLSHDSPASPYGPFMVELFTAFGFAEGRRGCQPRFCLSPSQKLPTPVEVERSPKRSNPLSRITRQIVASPASIDDDPTFVGRVRVARIHCGVKPLDRIDRLLALETSGITIPGLSRIGLLVEASIELGEHLSMHPALRAVTYGW